MIGLTNQHVREEDLALLAMHYLQALLGIVGLEAYYYQLAATSRPLRVS